MPVEKRGNLTKQNAFDDVVARIRQEFKRRLKPIAERYEAEFVQQVLSQSGPRTLGQRTGQLANTFNVTALNTGDFGALRVGVPAGTAAHVYGSQQNQRIGWFEHGLAITQDELLRDLQEQLRLAFRSEN